MRDVGTLVWVVLIVIGVVSSMISSVRRQVQAQRRPMPAAPRPTPAAVRFAPDVRAEPRVHAPQEARPAPRAEAGPAAPMVFEAPPQRPRLFEGRGDLVRAVIAAEVLGKPRALSDEPFLR